HREPLAGDAAEVALAGNGAVKHGVADDDALLRHDPRVGIRPHDQLAAGEALADVVVALADEIERDTVGEPRAEALPGRALEGQPDGIVRQSGMAVAPGHLAGERRTGRAVAVADRQLVAHRLLLVQR